MSYGNLPRPVVSCTDRFSYETESAERRSPRTYQKFPKSPYYRGSSFLPPFLSVLRQTMRRRALLTYSGVTLTSAFAGCLNNESELDEPPARGSTSTETSTSPTTTDSSTDTPEESDTETPTEEATPEETEEPTEEPDPDSGRGNWSEGWYVQPASWTAATPENLDCENDDATRVHQGFDESDFVWGNAEAWEMRISETAVNHGDTIHIKLKNVTDETRSRYAGSMYHIQVETESGWQEVRTYESRKEWRAHPAVVRGHGPGESSTWELTMNEEDFAGDVCPPLQDGRYRFVYYGFEEDEDRPVGIGFNLST